MTAQRKRMALLALTGVIVLILAVLGAMAGGTGEAQGSSVSRGPAGWLAARKYLEARGAKATLWRESLENFTGGGVLVETFPWQYGAPTETTEAAEAIENHLRRGGDVVLAWSGGRPNAGEWLALEELGLPLEEVRKVPLNLIDWRRFVRQEWDLRPVSRPVVASTPPAGSTPLRVWAPRRMPALRNRSQDLEVLYRTPAGRPAVVRLRRYRGSLWLLPADALANARLGTAGNADLLETLLARLGPRWTFDEYHHGLVAVAAAEDETFTRLLDLVLWHLALLYLLAVWTLSRRFGPAWREAPVVTGSVASFLLGLGAMHHRLEHHGQAVGRLFARFRELYPDLTIPEDLARRGRVDGTARDLVEVARSLVRLRRGDRLIPFATASDLATTTIAPGDRR